MQIAKCKLRQAYISAIACINLLARRIPLNLSGIFPGEASDLCLTFEEKNHDAEMRFGASLHAKLDLLSSLASSRSVRKQALLI